MMPLYVHLLELARVPVHLRECELFAQFVAVAVVRVDVDRLFEQERLIQTVQLLSNRFLLALDPAIRCIASPSFRQAWSTRSFTSRMKPAIGCSRVSSSTKSSSTLADVHGAAATAAVVIRVVVASPFCPARRRSHRSPC
jgi:hypothetical protein